VIIVETSDGIEYAPLRNRPDVSVLIPAYNAADTLYRAIGSALDQAHIDVEVVVSDDGSTDATAQVAHEYGDPRVRLVQGAGNTGVSEALNRAAEAAHGRYFIELDSDDYFEADSVHRLVRALDDAPANVGFAYGCTQYHNDADFAFTPAPYHPELFRRGNAALYPFLYRREAWDAGVRYHTLMQKPGGGWYSIQDWDMLLQLIYHMRYDGVALPDVLVLHYNYDSEGAHQSMLREFHALAFGTFKLRWGGILKATRIG